jgi:hypothetical protein
MRYDVSFARMQKDYLLSRSGAIVDDSTSIKVLRRHTGSHGGMMG